jgi:Holliday junction resolvase
MAKRTDSNQREIVDIFRAIGATVQILSMVGKGCPDIIVGYQGVNYLIEIKDGKKPPSGQKLTEHEEKFFNTWKGQVCLINSSDQAIALLEKYMVRSNG